MKELCPCGSGRDYTACCGPIIRGKEKAPTAEALMRSRYSAYVKGEIDHIVSSCTQDDAMDRESTENWSRKADWKGLEILRVEKGGPDDTEGVVEFAARYTMDGRKEEHRETANFIRKEGAWLYDSGEVKTVTVVRAAPKVGRNEPCPCGSVKKYKQCCGK